MLNSGAVDRVFHALGDPTRRAIVERLSSGSATVSELARLLDITLAAVVQHLQVLEDSGVVRTEKLGRVRACHIRPDGLAFAERWIAERRGAPWDREHERFGEAITGSTVSVSTPRRRDRT